MRSEEGFTVAEVVIAILILGLATLAVVQIFAAATRNSFRAEQSQVANDIAQREIEKIRNLDYNQIALSSTPAHVDDSTDPRERVESGGTRFDASNNGSLFDMVRNGGALDGGGTINCSGASAPCISPGPESFTSGDVSGRIFRFVVWRNDPTCSPAVCAGSQDLKRVIIAVKLDAVAVSGQRAYVEVQSDFTDPNATLVSDLPTGNEVNVPQQFWLTDTACSATSRQPIDSTGGDLPGEGHALHNTLGACADGLKTGATTGAPDLLVVEPPPDPTPSDEADPPILDYATDLEPASGPDDDQGLQITRESSNGCSYTGGSGSPEQKVHRWVTPTISTFPVTTFTMSGSATLELYLRTLGGAQHSGRICTYLYKRSAEVTNGGNTTWTDTAIDSDTFDVPTWPTSWGRVRIPLSFPATTLLATERLLVAISIDRGGTPADTVQVMYDHPDYQSRLEVVTSTPLGE